MSQRGSLARHSRNGNSCFTYGGPNLKAAFIIAVLLVLLIPATASSAAESPLQQVSENVYLFRDTCNVYAVKVGDEALLFDFGSGRVMDHLPDIGVKKVAWVLHTHYHRDQCQGDGVLSALGVKVAVPAGQARFFQEAEKVWDEMKLYRNFFFKPDFFEPTHSIKVDRAIQAGETFEWAGLRFGTLPCIGHTKEPGLVYMAEIDGKKVAFTGDLIHSPGKLWNYHDLQWAYNQLTGSEAAVESLKAVKDAAPDVLLPSHGVVMEKPSAAIDETLANLGEVIDVLRWHPSFDRGGLNQRLFPHIAHWETSYMIISDSGRALFYDAYETDDPGVADAQMKEVMEKFGIKKVDRILPSHYHHDHVGSIPLLKEKYGAELWVHESMADIIEHPYRYNLPTHGVGRHPDEAGPKIDRVLKGTESFEWEGWKFTVFHFPGQTEYHIGMYAEIDGHRMLFMGDSTYRPEPGTIFRGENFNCRNYCRLGEGAGYLRCGEILKEYNPDLAMAAHFGAIPLDETKIEEYYQWAKKLEPAFRKLIAGDDPNFGTDPNWMSFYPYRVFGEAGETVETEVRIRNHSDHDAVAKVRPMLPQGWRAEPAEATISIPAKRTGAASFRLLLAEGQPLPLRSVITADVIFDGTDYGEFPQMLIDKRSEKDIWASRVQGQIH